jgi:CRP-like cAMP-binding protein
MSSTPRSKARSLVLRSPRRVSPRTGVPLRLSVLDAPQQLEHRGRVVVVHVDHRDVGGPLGEDRLHLGEGDVGEASESPWTHSWAGPPRSVSCLAAPGSLPRTRTARDDPVAPGHEGGGIVVEPQSTWDFHARNVRVHIRARVLMQYDPAGAKRTSMGTLESVGSHLGRLLPGADTSTLRRLERGAQQQTFGTRDVLHARGIPLPPFVVLEGHVMTRRVAETGQVYGTLIAGPGYLGGLRAISDRDGEAFYELVALTDGTWATWDPGFVRGLALEDGGLAVGLLDLASDFAVVLNVRLDERSFENARQRMAAILTRYGKAIFDTRHPVAQRADLAAMIGTSRVGMYRTLRGLEADGLVKRERSGGIKILDEERLAELVTVASPEGAPALCPQGRCRRVVATRNRVRVAGFLESTVHP